MFFVPKCQKATHHQHSHSFDSAYIFFMRLSFFRNKTHMKKTLMLYLGYSSSLHKFHRHKFLQTKLNVIKYIEYRSINVKIMELWKREKRVKQ